MSEDPIGPNDELKSAVGEFAVWLQAREDGLSAKLSQIQPPHLYDLLKTERSEVRVINTVFKEGVLKKLNG